jgi:hypothetical protein
MSIDFTAKSTSCSRNDDLEAEFINANDLIHLLDYAFNFEERRVANSMVTILSAAPSPFMHIICPWQDICICFFVYILRPPWEITVIRLTTALKA